MKTTYYIFIGLLVIFLLLLISYDSFVENGKENSPLSGKKRFEELQKELAK